MLKANDIKNVKFSKGMGGYKQEEVEVFLDKIESDYLQFERICKDYQAKIDSCEKEIKELKEAQNSIQSVLLSAQGLADRIVNEAKEKSEALIRNAEINITEITSKEKELSAAFELKAQERKNALEKELALMVKEAQTKADSITAAANDSVARQQMLFDRLKLEIAAFKTSVSNRYREHIELLNKLPDTVPSDPQYITKLVSETLDRVPEPEEFIEKPKQSEESILAALVDESQEDTEDGFRVEDLLVTN